MRPRPAQSYVLRIWWEPSECGSDAWRASLTEVHTREAHYFASLEALVDYLTLEASMWSVHGGKEDLFG